jgi:effector-binding domain-containing protein
MTDTNHEIEEKVLQPMLIASIRMKGKYSDCGKGFAPIGRKFGRHICGPAMLLMHDTEYREDDADFEACMPIRSGTSVEGIDVRQLAGGDCVSLIHKGPYSDVGPTYEKLLAYVQEKGYNTASPSRELYLKGPGMIFRGNPKKYLTEVQMMIGRSTHD